jgi:hypothetical protein
VLREVSKKRPDLTLAFLREHRKKVSGLTMREGAKYLPAAQRRTLGLAPKAAWAPREEKAARRRPG